MLRRDFGRLAAIAAVLAALTPSSPLAAEETPRQGGSLTWAVETDAATLNPQLNGQDKTKLYLRQVYEWLLFRTDEGDYLPWLATAYDVSEDGRTYRFTLRDDVRFTDGEKLTAAAVALNFEKLRDPAYSKGVASGPIANLEEIKVLDERSLELRLKRVYAPFLDYISSVEIISPRAYESEQLAAGGPQIAGTGPFILAEYQRGQRLRYVRNPDYNTPRPNAAHQGPAYLDEVIYRFLPESSVRTGALLSGQVDVIEGISGNDASLFQDDPKFSYLRSFNTGTPYSIFLNAAYGPTQDLRVRKAIQASVDLERVIQSIYRGQRQRAWGINTPADAAYYDASIEGAYGFDPELANRLLDEAGWTGRDAEGYRLNAAGERLRIHLVQSQATVRDQRDVLLQAVQAQAKQNAGIEIDIEYVDAGTYAERRKSGEYSALANSNIPTDGVDVEYKYLPQDEGGTHGFSRASRATHPELAEWLLQASRVIDRQTRFDLYAKVQRYVVVDQALVVPLYVPEDQIAAGSYVRGVGFRSFKQLHENAYDVWLDK